MLSPLERVTVDATAFRSFANAEVSSAVPAFVDDPSSAPWKSLSASSWTFLAEVFATPVRSVAVKVLLHFAAVEKP
jgi:hypothetical protein